jgi:hypothetical protein
VHAHFAGQHVRAPASALSTGFSGLFLGTFSPLAYAAYAPWRNLARPVRCAFVAEARGQGGAA